MAKSKKNETENVEAQAEVEAVELPGVPLADFCNDNGIAGTWLRTHLRSASANGTPTGISKEAGRWYVVDVPTATAFVDELKAAATERAASEPKAKKPRKSKGKKAKAEAESEVLEEDVTDADLDDLDDLDWGDDDDLDGDEM